MIGGDVNGEMMRELTISFSSRVIDPPQKTKTKKQNLLEVKIPLRNRRSLTILNRHSTPDPPGHLINHNILHAVLSPLPQHRRNLLPGSNPRRMETENRHRRFDPEEPRQPVLVLGMDFSCWPRGRYCSRNSARWLVAVTTGYAGGASVRESSAHEGGAVDVRRRGRVNTGGIVEVVV